jgi:hypothetical protein
MLFIVPAGAHVTKSTGHLWSNHIQPRVQQGWVETRFAVVDGTDGTIARGKKAVSAERLSEGNYIVTFDTDVRNCAYLINPGGVDQEIPSGFASATRMAGQPAAVFVRTYDAFAMYDDYGFHLQIVC